ncbi:RNA polymerase II elongation factor ELL3 [Alca torda]
MSQPRAELRGRLRYRGCGPGPRLSLLHVRLSAAAARALRGCGRWQFLTVPGGPGTPPRLFAFSLSRCGRDERQGSFECVRLTVPRNQDCGPSSLSFLVPLQQPPEHGSPQATSRNLLGVHSPKDRACLSAGRKQGAQRPWAGGGPRGTESQHRGQDSLRQSKFAFQKRLALLDFSDPRASKRHRSRPRTLSTQHPGTLAPSNRAGELESPRSSQEETGHGWEESAPRPEQHPSVPRAPCLTRNGGSTGCKPGLGTALPARCPPRQGPRQNAAPPAPAPAAGVPQAHGERASPGHCSRYCTICSAEQRRAYEAAFGADYAEYRRLHARVGNVSRRFIQLGAKMKTLKQGTKEHKARGSPGAGWCHTAVLRLCSHTSFWFQALEATILHEYSHFKKVRLDAGHRLCSLQVVVHINVFFFFQTYPSYHQEKNRCEYLHQKLSHIKSLILQFEGSGSS